MKTVLISIKPKWCEKIASGEKTIEVRKTAPKEVPFKCYIYCTYGNMKENYCLGMRGKVIGEFVCDKINEWKYLPDHIDNCGHEYYIKCKDGHSTCLTYDEIENYGKGKTLYGWHISNLKIYDKPKAITEFKGECRQQNDVQCENCPYCDWNGFKDFCKDKRRIITRPPQSWCYVE